LLLSHKRKVELASLTPIKALRSGATLMMWTPADDAAWVMRCQAVTKQLMLREAAAKAGASAQEVAGPGDAARGPEPAEAVLGDARLEVPGAGGLELGSIVMT
jgi:hypothetical protein